MASTSGYFTGFNYASNAHVYTVFARVSNCLSVAAALKMAFSAESGRKAAYSDDLRWRIVWQRIAQEKPYRDIAKNLNISVGTVHNIWQKFEATGDISKEEPREREC